MALPFLLHLLRSPGNWQGQAGGACGPCTTSPSWLGCWAFPRSPQSPAGPFLGPWGPSGGRDATQSSAPGCCPQRCSGDPRAQPPGLCLHPCQASSTALSLNRTDSSAFCAPHVLRRKWGAVSPSSSGSVSGGFVHLAASGWGGVARRASCASHRAWGHVWAQAGVPHPGEHAQGPAASWKLQMSLSAPPAADCFYPGQICVPVESSSPLVMSSQKSAALLHGAGYAGGALGLLRGSPEASVLPLAGPGVGAGNPAGARQS